MAHSNASYLSKSEGRSKAGVNIYLGDGPNDIAMNALINIISVSTSTVVSSATEAEYAALFIVGQAETSFALCTFIVIDNLKFVLRVS